jgi:AcrR family transcriptional regulator
MVRVSKEPEKRRQELVDAAERLFLTRGYEQTAVSDIVKEIKVAQGTFYYHFQSKAEILEEVLKKSILSLVEKIRPIAEEQDMEPVEKLNQFYSTLAEFGNSNMELMEFIHRESNLPLHDRLGKVTMVGLVPLLSQIIRDGMRQKAFTVTHPVETARFLLLASGELFHDPELLERPDGIEKARATAEQCVARVLGIKEGAFKMNL